MYGIVDNKKNNNNRDKMIYNKYIRYSIMLIVVLLLAFGIGYAIGSSLDTGVGNSIQTESAADLLNRIPN